MNHQGPVFWEDIERECLQRAQKLIGKNGCEHTMQSLLVSAGIAHDKTRKPIIRNDWVPEMNRLFCTLKQELRQELKPWYKRWFSL